jgi:preprotein translocase subunit YajC
VDDGGQALQQILFFALLIVGLYLLAIRPQRVRARALAQVQAALAVDSQVITTAGIHARVAAIDGDDVVLEIAPGVQVRFARAAVVRVLPEPPSTSEQPQTNEPA